MQHGHTLAEAVASIAVASALLTATLPSALRTLDQNRRATEINRLVASIHLARSEARRRGMTVTVCPSADGAGCGPREDWGAGWLVYAGERWDGAAAHWTDGEILHVHRSRGTRAVIANRDRFSFRAHGGRRSTNGTITFCHAHAGAARAVVVNHMGRPRLDAGPAVDARCPSS